MNISTNKGIFKVKDCYTAEDKTVLVVATEENGIGPFEGEQGNEIPIEIEMKTKYEAVIL